MKKDLNKEFLIRCKVYIDRARMYMGYIQFLMVVGVFINEFKSRLPQICTQHPIASIIIGIILLIIGSLVIGWLDYRLGLFQAEAKRHSELNPVLTELSDKLDELKTLVTKWIR